MKKLALLNSFALVYLSAFFVGIPYSAKAAPVATVITNAFDCPPLDLGPIIGQNGEVIGDNFVYCIPLNLHGSDDPTVRSVLYPAFIKVNNVVLSPTSFKKTSNNTYLFKSASFNLQTNASNLDLSPKDFFLGLNDCFLNYQEPKISSMDSAGNFQVSFNNYSFKIVDSNCQQGTLQANLWINIDQIANFYLPLNTLPHSKLMITPLSGFAIANKACTNLSEVKLDSSGKQYICAKISGKLLWTAVPGAPLPQASPKPSNLDLSGQACSTAGQIKSTTSGNFVCALKGKVKTWISISGTKATPKATATTVPSSAPKQSQADSLVVQGCASFPAAIVALGRQKGPGPELMNAQNAAYFIQQAAALDSKYQTLKTAQNVIIQYAQATNWTGKGYLGDINTVRFAIDTFNSACGSNIHLP